jgi:hypothetical protein
MFNALILISVPGANFCQQQNANDGYVKSAPDGYRIAIWR